MPALRGPCAHRILESQRFPQGGDPLMAPAMFCIPPLHLALNCVLFPLNTSCAVTECVCALNWTCASPSYEQET